MKLYVVCRYSVDEGEVVEGSGVHDNATCEDKAHTKWVANLRNREAAENDEPYVYVVEEVA